MIVLPKLKLPILLLVLGLLVSCSESDEALKKSLTRVMKENPDFVINVIDENPTLFTESIQKAFLKSREELAQARALQQKEDFYHSFENPLRPKIRDDEVIRGNPEAKLTLVEYVDFECTFCARGHQTVKELEKRYEGHLRVIVKHLPLSFHDQAMPAARYYEALRLQHKAHAIAFYHKVFEHQSELARGELFLREMAQEIGADMELLKNDLMNNDEIDNRIEADMDEAERFRLQGTPGFVLGGIPIRGAYPVEHFIKVINELERRRRLNVAHGEQQTLR